ncbi:MAG: tetratricopeptide repeat protein [Spirochaetaceae bacterium]|nr:tetratricopeptide repeat protein [Spirochaetaceae bacterium]
MVTTEYYAYMYTVVLFTEKDLAGIIKFHPETLNPIKKVLTHYSWKVIENNLNYTPDISDEKYLFFKKILEQNLIEALEKEQKENDQSRENIEKCANCGGADISWADFCINCGKYFSEDRFALAEQLFFQRGTDAYFSQDYDNAIKEFSELIMLDQKKSKTKKSKQTAKKTKTNMSPFKVYNPRKIIFDAYCYRGEIYQKKGQYDEAIADFTGAMKTNPENNELYSARAEAYISKGLYDEAISDLEEALKWAPAENRLFEARAEIYEAQGEYQKALDDWKEALEIRQTEWTEKDIEYFSGSILTYEKYINMNLARCEEQIKKIPQDTKKKPKKI